MQSDAAGRVWITVLSQMAAHESAQTTPLYHRRSDKITLDEVERIVL
jgi:hypothetical protein